MNKKNDKHEKGTAEPKQRRLTKEQLEAIRGGVSNSQPNPGTKPVFYTEPAT